LFFLLHAEKTLCLQQAVEEVLRGTRVVFATLTGCADRLLRDSEMFDVVVIDEAGQVRLKLDSDERFVFEWR